MVIKNPGWRYHATQGKRLVQSEAEEAELGPGWSDSLATPPEIVDAPESSVDSDDDPELETLYEPDVEKKAKKRGSK